VDEAGMTITHLSWDDGRSSTIHRPYYHHYLIRSIKQKRERTPW
jgi:hypothetical protein